MKEIVAMFLRAGVTVLSTLRTMGKCIILGMITIPCSVDAYKMCCPRWQSFR